jgi:serine/threonine protein kinase
MHHPNIVTLRESYDSKGGRKNIVMEVADGDNLHEEVKHRKFVSRCQKLPLEYISENKILGWFT